MKKSFIVGLIVFVGLTLFANNVFAILVPTPPPTNVSPLSEGEFKVGYGYSQITLVFDWIDDIYAPYTEEKYGEIAYTANNFVYSQMKGEKEGTNVIEYMAGTLTAKEIDGTFKESDGTVHKGTYEASGINGGFRLKGIREFKEKEEGNVQWNYSWNLMALAYNYQAHIEMKEGGVKDYEYDETVTGVLVKPMLLVQPDIAVYSKLHFIPYAGGSAVATLSYAEWTEQGFTDDDLYLNLNAEIVYGFDLALKLSESNGSEISLGAVFSHFLIGDEGGQSGSYHLMYSVRM